ncbi:MAG: alginate export family protein [Pseudomonadota bacterium]
MFLKVFLFILIWLLTITLTHANDPDFKMYRWLEDYQYLKNETEPDWYDSIKYTPIGDESYASFGGTLRQRFNHFDNDRFGLFGAPDGYLLLHRLLLHGDFHFGENFRAFVEIGSHLVDKDDLRPGPFDKDKLDITQAFFDLKSNGWVYRVGRQEMKLGSTRLVGVRNGPNVRRAFDGVRIDKQFNSTSYRVFALSQVDVDEETFSNDANTDDTLWGLYTTTQFKRTSADIYYVGSYRANAEYFSGEANEKRHSLGTRIFGKKATWDWNFEAIYQFGDFGDQEINAWTLASRTGYTLLSSRWKPRFSLSANIASGDDNANDDKLKTFNPLFPNLSYFEEASVLAPQNFYNLEPEIRLILSESLTFSADWDIFWRLEENDAVYVRGLNPLNTTVGSSGDLVAHIPSVSFDYQVNRHVALDMSYSYYIAEEVIEDAGGDDIHFFKLEASWVF